MADRLPDHRDVLKHVCEEKLGRIMLKPEQSEATELLLNGKDVLPTGFGKSLINQSFVFAKEIMDGPFAHNNCHHSTSQHRLGAA